jgi:hypothetical protein
LHKAKPLKINANATIDLYSISDRHYCAIIDDFLVHPEEAVKYASLRASDFITSFGYPGIIYPPETVLLDEIYRFIRTRLNGPLGFLRGSIKFSSYFAMASLTPQELTCLQRLCHTDPKPDRGRTNIAALLYLFDNPDLGGTAFYRWKEREVIVQATAISQDTPDKVLPFLAEKFPMFRDPARYITDSNEVAEMLHNIPARFNRLIVYSGDIPHSAYIKQPELLTKEIATGRLTLNCFASVLPRTDAPTTQR